MRRDANGIGNVVGRITRQIGNRYVPRRHAVAGQEVLELEGQRCRPVVEREDGVRVDGVDDRLCRGRCRIDVDRQRLCDRVEINEGLIADGRVVHENHVDIVIKHVRYDRAYDQIVIVPQGRNRGRAENGCSQHASLADQAHAGVGRLVGQIQLRGERMDCQQGCAADGLNLTGAAEVVVDGVRQFQSDFIVRHIRRDDDLCSVIINAGTASQNHLR